MPSTIHVRLPESKHTHTIILLHGRGSNATEFASDFFESQDSSDRYLYDIFPSFKWVFPQASLRYPIPIPIPNEEINEEKLSSIEQEQVPELQWFNMPPEVDVRYSGYLEDEHKKQLEDSISSILRLVEKEVGVEEVGAEHVFLGGISQGCATAICALMGAKMRLAGFVGMSSWLPYHQEILNIYNEDYNSSALGKVNQVLRGKVGVPSAVPLSDVALQTPVFIAHSEDDDVVPVKYGESLVDGLRCVGMVVKWQRYQDGGHWVNEPQGVDDIVEFIRAHAQFETPAATEEPTAREFAKASPYVPTFSFAKRLQDSM